MVVVSARSKFGTVVVPRRRLSDGLWECVSVFQNSARFSCAVSGSLNVPLHQRSGSAQSGSPIMAVIHAMFQRGMGLGVLRILIFYVGSSASDCVFVPSECCHRCN